MRRAPIVVVMSALFALGPVTGASAAPAEAAPAVYFGHTCETLLVWDPQIEVSYTGYIRGGPWSAASAVSGEVANLRMTCTIQTGANATPPAPNAASPVTAVGRGVVTVGPSSVTVEVGAAEDVYLCTRVEWDTLEGGHEAYYYDAVTNEMLPTHLGSAIQCPLAISFQDPFSGRGFHYVSSEYDDSFAG